MATTFLQVTNEVLSELNEVQLTAATFPSARSVQLHTQNAINKAYFDINNAKFKWPWLSTAASLNESYGNTYIESIAGQRWYLLKDASADINSDYGHVDWETFLLTEEGVAGKTAPYEQRDLRFTEIEEWKDHWLLNEEKDKSDSQVYGIPTKILANPDGRRFGLSPIPKGVYRIYFYAWNRPVKLTLQDDVVAIPDQFVSVLVSRARYYVWQRKENPQQAAIALEEYLQGLDEMTTQTIHQAPKDFTDTRVRF
jgi:hypothetical protein